MGALSALPLVSAGNLCCCLWVIAGGVTAAYVLQQNETTPITPADGALVGLLAGLIGAVVYLVLSIPITILLAPIERAIEDRLIELGRGMPPGFRGYLGSAVGRGVRLMFGFIFMLFLGSFFSTLGGLLGAAIFRKSPPQPPPSAPPPPPLPPPPPSPLA